MLSSPISITYDGASVSMKRINQDNYSSEYYGKNAAGDAHLTLSVKHTIPARGDSGESHLIRLDVEHFDADGVYERTVSVWNVMKTTDGTQDDVALTDAQDALTALVPTIDDSVIGRES